MRHLHGILLATVLAAAAPAQRVWIVDNLNTATAHFIDLPAAIASPLVMDGDVLLLRPGTGRYSGGVFSKGVAIVAPTRVTIGFPQSAALVVGNIAFGRRFSLRNVDVEGLPSHTPITLTGCAGSVHLDQVRITGGFPVQNPGIPGLRCTACAAVVVQGCRIEGKPAIHAIQSSVAVTSSTIVGTDAAIGDNVGVPAGSALVASSSHVTIALTTMSGGSGASSTFWNLFQAGREAVIATSGSITIGGTNLTSSCIAGFPMGTEAIPAVVLNGIAAGSAAIDPRVRLQSRNGAPVVQGAPPNTMRPVAALGAARPTPLAVNVTVARRQGDLVALLGGFAVAPLPGPLGREWLDPGIRALFGTAFVDASEISSFPLQAPNVPAVLGASIALQAVVLSGGSLELTNPTVVVLGA